MHGGAGPCFWRNVLKSPTSCWPREKLGLSPSMLLDKVISSAYNPVRIKKPTSLQPMEPVIAWRSREETAPELIFKRLVDVSRASILQLDLPVLSFQELLWLQIMFRYQNSPLSDFIIWLNVNRGLVWGTSASSPVPPSANTLFYWP